MRTLWVLDDDPDTRAVLANGPEAVVWAEDEDRAAVRASIMLTMGTPPGAVMLLLTRHLAADELRNAAARVGRPPHLVTVGEAFPDAAALQELAEHEGWG